MALAEGFRYIRPLLEERHDGIPDTPDCTKPIVFNGPLIDMKNNEWYLFPREQTAKQIPGVPDAPASIGVYRVDPDSMESTHVQSIPVSDIKGDPAEFPANVPYSPEDLRGIPVSGSRILFGLTAARGGDPYPAIVYARKTTGGFTFRPMTVLKHLGCAKNVMPLSEDILMWRPEIAVSGHKHRFSFARRDPQSDTWSYAGETVLPEIPWLNNLGRYGLTGWQDRIEVPNRPGRERLIIHANRVVGRVTEYALLLAEIQQVGDGTFYFRNVDKRPFLTAGEAKNIVFSATGRRVPEPDPQKYIAYSVGGLPGCNGRCDEHDVPLTISDREIHYIGYPRERMLREFGVA